MNDFDQAGRYAVKHGPRETKSWLFPRATALRSAGWLDSQSAPRPGEPDRRCDTILALSNDEGPWWAAVIELFTEPDGEAIDRGVEYLGRYRRELRHGPHGRDRFDFALVLIFLTGAPPQTRLNMNLPGMPEVGLWLGPVVMDVAEQDAVAHLEAIEQNRLDRWLLVWLPLMKGGQTQEAARRWRALAEPEKRLLTMVDLTLTFARLTGCEDVYKKEMEGFMLKISPYMEEARQEERVKMAQRHTLRVLDLRFPGQVPVAVRQRIGTEADLDVLDGWLGLAITESLETIQERIK